MIYTQPAKFEVPSLDIMTLLFDSPHAPTTPDTPLHAFADHPDQVLRQRDVLRYALQTASFLRARLPTSRSPAPVVSVLSTGHPLLPSLFFATVACGATYNPISLETNPEKIARQLSDGPASLLLCSADMAPLAREAIKLSGLGWSKVWMYDVAPGVVGVPRPILHPLAKEGDVHKDETRSGCDYTTQEALPSWERITDPDVLARTRVCLLYTSGTTSRTGAGKGVILSHQNLVAESFLPACIHRPVFEQWAKDPAAKEVTNSTAPNFVYRSIGHLPPSHISGIQSYFINAHYDAGIVYWMRSFGFSAFVNHCTRLRVTYIFTAVPIYGAIAQLPREKARALFGYMKLGLSGGAHLPNKIFKKIEQRLGSKVGGIMLGQVWGSTEATGTATYYATDMQRTEDSIASVGRLLPGMELRLVDHRGKDVPKGFPGEALIRGPIVSMGYHGNPEANEAEFTDDGWYRSGDVLSIQESGLIFVGPRKKELIRTAAGPVSPLDLELLLLSHPLIADAAVIGVPGAPPSGDENSRYIPFDAHASEVPRAYVVLAAGDGEDNEELDEEERAALEEDVVSFVAEILPETRHMWLEGGVEFVPSVPRNVTGKTLRWKLRDMYLARVGMHNVRVDELMGALDI